MIKNISFILFSIHLLLSCGSKSIRSSISKDKQDVLAKESFLRYDSERIEVVIQSKNPLISATALCHQGKFNRGLSKLKKQYYQNRKNEKYWNSIAICYYLKGNLGKAEYFLHLSINTAKKKKSHYAPAHNNLGILFLKQRHFDMAHQQFQMAIKKSPQFLTPHFNLVKLYIQFGQFDDALLKLHKLSEVSPLDTDILAGFGTIYVLKNEPNRSLPYFEKISPHDLSREDIALYYALSLYHIKHYKKAHKVLTQQKHTQIKSIRSMSKKLKTLILKALEQQGRDA